MKPEAATVNVTAKGYTLPVIADLLDLSESDVRTYLNEEAEQ